MPVAEVLQLLTSRPRTHTHTLKPMKQAEFISIYNNLGQKCRQVLQQKFTGKPNKQIAQILEINTEATVRPHLSKAY